MGQIGQSNLMAIGGSRSGYKRGWGGRVTSFLGAEVVECCWSHSESGVSGLGGGLVLLSADRTSLSTQCSALENLHLGRYLMN